jgi:hypothetical protein
MSRMPLEVVNKLLNNMMNGEVRARTRGQSRDYVSLNADDAELKRILPRTGTIHGPGACFPILVRHQAPQAPSLTWCVP